MTQETLENLSQENRKFPPSAEFAAAANGKAELYGAAAADHEGFWADKARSYLTWTKDFGQTHGDRGLRRCRSPLRAR